MKIDKLSSPHFLSNEKLQQFSLSRTKVAAIVAICAMALIAYYFLRPAKPVNRTFPPVPGTAPNSCQTQIHIDTSKINTTPVQLSSTILRIVKERDEASYPLADLKLEIFKLTKGQETHLCISRSSHLPMDKDVQSIKFSYLGRNGKNYQGVLYDRDPTTLLHQLQFSHDRLDNLSIYITKTDGTITRHTFTTK